MQFHEIINAKYSKESYRPVMQKDAFPVNAAFREYLQHYRRGIEIPLLYSDLINYSHADSLKDIKGKWTHWENAVYEPRRYHLLKPNLTLNGSIFVNMAIVFLLELR